VPTNVTMQIPTTDADTPLSAGDTPSPLTLLLNTNRGLLLSGLQFPYQTDIKVVSGKLTLAAANALPRQLPAGSSTLLPANKRFDLLLLPTIGVTAKGQCQIALDRASTHPGDYRRLLSRESARLVFESPADAWTAALLAERLGMSATRFRARLFVENTGVRCIVKMQRMMRALTMLLTTDLPIERIATSSGWPNGRALKLALHDGLLTDIARIERVQPKPVPLNLLEGRFWCTTPPLLFCNGYDRRVSSANGVSN
jgi:AraC-like DNA-binding protein